MGCRTFNVRDYIANPLGIWPDLVSPMANERFLPSFPVFVIARKTEYDDKLGAYRSSKFVSMWLDYRSWQETKCLPIFTTQQTMDVFIAQLTFDCYGMPLSSSLDLHSFLEQIRADGVQWVRIDPESDRSTKRPIEIDSLIRQLREME